MSEVPTRRPPPATRDAAAARYALQVDYGSLAGLAPLATRWAYRALLLGQPGYRRRRELRARDWTRIVEVFLFADAPSAEAALASAARRAFVAAHPACGDTNVALVLDEGDSRQGRPAVLLRPAPSGTPTDEAGWAHERLVRND